MKKLLNICCFYLLGLCCLSAQDSTCVVQINIDTLGSGIVLAADADGQSPFTYLWSTGATTSYIQPNTTGQFCVTITDATGCVASDCFDYGTNPIDSCGVFIYQDSTTVGDALIANANGTAPFSYVWSNGATTASIVPLVSDIYCVTVTDANGCDAVDCYNYGIVFPPDSCEVHIILDSLIFGGSSIGADPVGVAPFSYSWSTGETTQWIMTTGSGLYCVTMTDAVGCQSTACCGHSIGQDTLCDVQIFLDSLPTGLGLWTSAAGTGPFSYSWNTGATTPSLPLNAPGLYCVTVIDALGCEAASCYDYLTIDTSCYVQIYLDSLASGEALSAEAYGTAPYSYTWSTGETTSYIQPNTSGQYCVTVVDAVGCEAVACYYYNNLNCSAYIYEDSTGSLDLIAVASGQAPFTYNWDNGATTATIQPDSTGAYCVTITDADGCEAQTCYYYLNPIDRCEVYIYPDSSMVDQLTAYPYGTAPYTYEWNTGETTASVALSASLCEYCVTITDAIGCVSTNCYTVCNDDLWGLVIGPDSTAIGGVQGLVYLIQYDAVSGQLAVVDTANIEFGNYYRFDDIPFGDYLIKVALLPTAPDFDDFLPTYYGDVLFWDEATTVTSPVNLNNWPGYFINMIPGMNPGGPGFIGGLVTEGANFTGPGSSRGGEGDPIPNVSVILLDIDGNPVAHALTGEDGYYSFDNLPYGTYEVIIEIIGLEQASRFVTISPDVPSAKDINFIADEDSVATGVSNPLGAEEWRLYPNPASDLLTLEVKMPEARELVLSLNRIDGQQVWSRAEQLSTGSQHIQVSVALLQPGVYFLNLQDGKSVLSQRFIKL